MGIWLSTLSVKTLSLLLVCFWCFDISVLFQNTDFLVLIYSTWDSLGICFFHLCRKILRCYLCKYTCLFISIIVNSGTQMWMKLFILCLSALVYRTRPGIVGWEYMINSNWREASVCTRGPVRKTGPQGWSRGGSHVFAIYPHSHRHVLRQA